MSRQRALSALLWLASFVLAVAVFLAVRPLLRSLPPTEPVAIGLVTIEGASKLRDYATAALFYALVPVLTIAFRRAIPLWSAAGPAAPLSSFPAESAAGSAALPLSEAFAVSLYWSLESGSAWPFLAAPVFAFVLWKSERLARAALPLVVLPLLALLFVPPLIAIGSVVVASTIAFFVLPAFSTERLVRLAVIPFLLYCATYATLARPTPWIDLFHRGETLGPASDYLRGKVPYRDVFVLHGLLVDGQLDAWLMEWLGRDADVTPLRRDILAACAFPALWYLSLAIFGSLPLAVASMFASALIAVDNERLVLEIATVALLLAGLRGRTRPLVIAASGVMAALALFYSLEIGLYSIGGGVLFLAVHRRRVPLLAFLAGLAAGALPFVVYLTARGALVSFFETSMITIPAIIDAVWSTPFPDLLQPFPGRLRYVLAPVVIATSLVVLIHRALARRFEWLDTSLLAVTAFALLTQRTALGRADLQHQLFAASLIGPMLVILVSRAARGREVVVGLVIGAATLAAFPDIARLRLDRMVQYKLRLTRSGQHPIAVDVRERIRGIGEHVDRISQRNDPVFDFSNQPGLYFFLDRPNPTRFYQVPILSPADFQIETIAALHSTRTPVVIRRSPQGTDAFDGITNDDRAQAVAAYIDDRYTLSAIIRGVEIWKRLPERPLDFGSYVRAIHMPDRSDLVLPQARPRLVFPIEKGATFDLILENPLQQPLPLMLRHSLDGRHTDRRIRIPPRTRASIPVSEGLLWVEYRGGRPPIARLQSGTVTRMPLRPDDAISAGGTLTLPPSPSIGVVNVGAMPAVFRVGGRTINLGEGEQWTGSGGEQPTRIEVVSGTCVAFTLRP